MTYRRIYRIIWFVVIILFSNACVEQIDIEATLTFEDALVVEALITDEIKQQKIILSRTFEFDDDGPTSETNAQVRILDDAQNIYAFQESSPGNYISVDEFSALPNVNYRLQIDTKDGKTYTSRNAQLSGSTKIDGVYAERETDNSGAEYMSIFVDSFDPKQNSNYYRYEYEETYKIVAPYWVSKDLVLESGRLKFTSKTEEQETCYNTGYSNSIIQTETTNLSEDRVSGFKVRTISANNAIISHRYSILVKQYVQSLEAFTYHKTLNKLSGSESLLSQNQPGFISGNIFSPDNLNENVIGFFEVSSVSYQRLFFNYHDFFSEEVRPPYFSDCETFAPKIYPNLEELIKDDEVKYYMPNPNYPDPQDLNAGPYLVVPVECGDCTKLGTNTIPDFWVE